MLRYEAKRSPVLADMMTNIGLLSKADIQAAKMMPWVRQALLELKQTDDQQHLAVDLEQYIVDSVAPDPMGEMRRWLWDTTYIKIGKRKSLLEIKTGQLVWFDGNGGVWVDTVYSEVIDPALHAYTESCGAMTRLSYLDILRGRRNQNQEVPSTVTGNAPTNTDRAFTIYRPR